MHCKISQAKSQCTQLHQPLYKAELTQESQDLETQSILTQIEVSYKEYIPQMGLNLNLKLGKLKKGFELNQSADKAPSNTTLIF